MGQVPPRPPRRVLWASAMSCLRRIYPPQTPVERSRAVVDSSPATYSLSELLEPLGAMLHPLNPLSPTYIGADSFTPNSPDNCPAPEIQSDSYSSACDSPSSSSGDSYSSSDSSYSDSSSSSSSDF